MADNIKISMTSDKDYPILVENKGGDIMLDRDGAAKAIKIASKCLGESLESVCRGLADGKAVIIEDKYGKFK